MATEPAEELDRLRSYSTDGICLEVARKGLTRQGEPPSMVSRLELGDGQIHAPKQLYVDGDDDRQDGLIHSLLGNARTEKPSHSCSVSL